MSKRQTLMQLIVVGRDVLSKQSANSFGTIVRLPVPSKAVPWFNNVARGFKSFAQHNQPLASPLVKESLKRGFGSIITKKAMSSAAATAEQAVSKLTSETLVEGMSPEARKQVALWLKLCSGWVLSMVIIGGMTRLTRSGLSMTEWKFTGERPPLTDDDWQREFSKYKQSPEYKRVHYAMTLSEFKFIFWMEYGHRMWGRVLGLVFALPAAYFVSKGCINRALGTRLGAVFLMGGTQGLVGWWMVKSGLEEPKTEWETPRVSPYRLSAHLFSALTIYSTLVWTYMDIKTPTPLAATCVREMLPQLAWVRNTAWGVLGVLGLTAIMGSYMAGTQAGRSYNTWPFMGGKWIAEEYWAMDGVRNFFENVAAVNFQHRTMAAALVGGVMYLWSKGRPRKIGREGKLLLDFIGSIVVLQFTLGIVTLMEHVPVDFGTMHLGGALLTITLYLRLLHYVRPETPSYVLRQLGRYTLPASAACLVGMAALVSTRTKEDALRATGQIA